MNKQPHNTDRTAPGKGLDADSQCRAVEAVLDMHPGVRKAAVLRDETDALVAMVVPDDSYMDDVLSRGRAQAAAISRWQKTYDLTYLAKIGALAPIGFDTVTWDSSYTRRAIPVEDMREWVGTTVDAILQLRPKRVYEIGCGTGMLLTKIARSCDRYVGADFSREALGRLREQLETLPALAERVELMERKADDFDGLTDDSFDVVVINSVAQYFPNLAYLTDVLEGATRLIKSKGQVFIGDVRNLPLLSAFACSVELFQAAEELSIGELRDRVNRRTHRDPELVLSPAYFLSLQGRLPRVSKVEIQLRQGRGDNEMSRYRYSAILHVGQAAEVPSEVSFEDWTEHAFTVDEIRSMLQECCEPFGLKRIKNVRVEKDIRALEMLKSDLAPRTAGELRREVERCNIRGIHPQDLIELGKANLDFEVLISWAACRSDGSYDALFIPRGLLEQNPAWSAQWPQPESSSFLRVASAPGQSLLRKELLERILTHCRSYLIGNMVPSKIGLVDTLPETLKRITIPSDWLASYVFSDCCFGPAF
jgi:ubiquinone/menaquinone biosynthesis C-methylase UbiE